MDNKKIIGIDLGATNIRGGLVNGTRLSGMNSKRINSSG
jgi:predicted NBD/HSP70 family sugar kinase